MDDNDDPRCMFANILMIISVDQRNPSHKYLDNMEIFFFNCTITEFCFGQNNEKDAANCIIK